MKRTQSTKSFSGTFKATNYEPRKTFQNFNKNNEAMTRSQYPSGHSRTLHYFTNGTGRDTYIERYNGGFTVMHDVRALP